MAFIIAPTVFAAGLFEHARNVHTHPLSHTMEPDDGPKTSGDEDLRDEDQHERSPPEPDEGQEPPYEYQERQQSEPPIFIYRTGAYDARLRIGFALRIGKIRLLRRLTNEAPRL